MDPETMTFGEWVAEIEKRCHLLLPEMVNEQDS